MNERLIQAYADCLDSVTAGESVEACLARYPSLEAELRPLLELSRAALSLQAANPPPETRSASKQRLMRLVDRADRQRRPTARRRPRSRLALAALGLLLAVLIGGGGLLGASAQSLPGDRLYSVKRSAENLSLRLAPTGRRTLSLALRYDQRRLSEVRSLLTLGRVEAVRFEGLLVRISGSLYSFEDIPVLAVSTTQLGPGLSPGTPVVVEGTTQPHGWVQAHTIRAQGYSFRAQVNSMNDRFWEIGDMQVAVLPETRLSPGIGPGSLVLVTIRIQQDQEFASSILLPGSEPAPVTTQGLVDEIKFWGSVQSIDTSVWRIGGRRVLIGATTELRGAMAPGDFVEVEAAVSSQGLLVAQRIRPVEPSDQDEDGAAEEEIEFTGPLEHKGSGAWTIAGRQVTIGSQTRIDGDPAVGDLVRVRAHLDEESLLIADRIELRQRQDHPDEEEGEEHEAEEGKDKEGEEDEDDEKSGEETEFTGILESKSASTWIVAGKPVVLDSDTKIEGNPQVGDQVKVRARIQQDGSLVAEKIEVKEDD